MINSIGLDIRHQMCFASKQNGLKNLICCNALVMPVKARSVRAIVTDIPYGQSTYLLPNVTPEHLLFETIKIYGDIVDRIVIMCRSVDVEKLSDNSFDREYKIYYSYVHKSLTRCIMVIPSK
jgi:tRNA G10  N-methylase Trm11